MQEISRNVTVCHEARHRSRSVSQPRRRETPLAKCHGMSCFVMFPIPSPTLRCPVPAYRVSIAFRSVPPPAGPFAARIARGRARPSAPARFARLIARARRRAHVSRPFPPGLFSAPAAVLRRKGKGGPRKPPLPAHIIPHFPPGQAPIKNYFKNFANEMLSSDGGALKRREAPARRPVSPGNPEPPPGRAGRPGRGGSAALPRPSLRRPARSVRTVRLRRPP